MKNMTATEVRHLQGELVIKLSDANASRAALTMLSPGIQAALIELAHRRPEVQTPARISPCPPPPWHPDPIVIRALEHLRDTTNSKSEHDSVCAYLSRINS